MMHHENNNDDYLWWAGEYTITLAISLVYLPWRAARIGRAMQHLTSARHYPEEGPVLSPVQYVFFLRHFIY